MKEAQIKAIGNVICEAFESGRNSAIREAGNEIQAMKTNIDGLKTERDMMVRRINELTTNQWETICAVIKKVYPETEHTVEDIQQLASRK